MPEGCRFAVSQSYDSSVESSGGKPEFGGFSKLCEEETSSLPSSRCEGQDSVSGPGPCLRSPCVSLGVNVCVSGGQSGCIVAAAAGLAAVMHIKQSCGGLCVTRRLVASQSTIVPSPCVSPGPPSDPHLVPPTSPPSASLAQTCPTVRVPPEATA